MCEIPWPILIAILHRWVQYLGCGWDRPLGSRNGPSAIGPQLFCSSAVVWYVMCHYFLNWVLWMRFHDRYWYQSFIDRSTIWGVDRIDHWGPDMDHPPLGRSYLVVVPLYDISCALIFFNGGLWVRFHGRYWYQSLTMGPIFGVWIGPTLGVPKRTIRNRAAAIW